MALLHYLKQKYSHHDHVDICLLEKNAHLGGTIRSIIKNGCLFETGPNGFLDSKKRTLDLIGDLQLENTPTVTGSPNVGAVVSSNAMATAHLNIVCGDLDSNGVVDILDIIIYLMLVVDLQDPSLYQQKVGDLNLDGSVDIIDAIMGLEHIMNSAPTASNC